MKSQVASLAGSAEVSSAFEWSTVNFHPNGRTPAKLLLSVARKKVKKKLAINGLSEPHFSSLDTNF